MSNKQNKGKGFERYSVAGSAAVVAAQRQRIYELVKMGYPHAAEDPLALIATPAWTKIIKLEVLDACPRESCSESMDPDWNGLCAYKCRRGSATVHVAFREGEQYEVVLKGFEMDERKGVSITEVVSATLLNATRTASE